MKCLCYSLIAGTGSRNVTHSVTNDFFFYFEGVKMLAALCVGWVFI